MKVGVGVPAGGKHRRAAEVEIVDPEHLAVLHRPRRRRPNAPCACRRCGACRSPGRPAAMRRRRRASVAGAAARGRAGSTLRRTGGSRPARSCDRPASASSTAARAARRARRSRAVRARRGSPAAAPAPTPRGPARRTATPCRPAPPGDRTGLARRRGRGARVPPIRSSCARAPKPRGVRRRWHAPASPRPTVRSSAWHGAPALRRPRARHRPRGRPDGTSSIAPACRRAVRHGHRAARSTTAADGCSRCRRCTGRPDRRAARARRLSNPPPSAFRCARRRAPVP